MHEIIHVVDRGFAAGSDGEIDVEVVAGEALQPGHYLVIWPTRPCRSRERGKRYFGPLGREAARLLQTSAVALGLVQQDCLIPGIAECHSIGLGPAVRQAESFRLTA